MFSLVRLIALYTVGVCSIALVGLSASFPFTLGIIISVLTVFTIFPIIILDFFRKGAFTTWTAVELTWVGLLSILWLSSGAISASMAAGLCNICDTGMWRNGVCLSRLSNASLCSGTVATTSFSLIGFFILIAIWIWTLAIGVSAHNKGDRQIWMMPAYQYVPKTKNVKVEETEYSPPVEVKFDAFAPPKYSSKPE